MLGTQATSGNKAAPQNTGAETVEQGSVRRAASSAFHFLANGFKSDETVREGFNNRQFGTPLTAREIQQCQRLGVQMFTVTSTLDKECNGIHVNNSNSRLALGLKQETYGFEYSDYNPTSS